MSALGRCESCFALKRVAALTPIDGGHECRRCAKRWYVLAVEPGQDTPARKAIVRAVRVAGLGGLVGRVVVPKHVVTERRDGVPVRVRRKAFPGYLLVQMIYTPDLHHLIAGVRGVWGLLPLKPVLRGFRYPRGEPKQGTPARRQDVAAHEAWRPTSVASEELAMALIRNQAARKKTPPPAAFAPGTPVRFVSGVWADRTGVVRKAAGDKVVVGVPMLGTVVEVETPPAAVEREGCDE